MLIRKPLIPLSIVIFLVAVLLRSIYITAIPPLLTYDESYYGTEAAALLAHGSDLRGSWKPWQLIPANPLYSELTGATQTVGFFLFPNEPLLAMKTLPVLFGSLLPLLLALITYRLTKSNAVYITTAIVATVNPWLFQFSRMAFDSLFSVFFYSVGIVLLLYAKRWNLLWAAIPFFWGFFQYQGHKPLLVPLVLLTVLFLVLENEKRISWRQMLSLPSLKKYAPHLLLIIFTCVLSGLYLLRLPTTLAAGRVGEFQILNTGTLSEGVDLTRRLTIDNGASSLFDNKLTAILASSLARFMGSFDISWLFLHGNERVDSFAVTRFGFLYAIDAFLLLFGFVSLIKEKKLHRIALFIFGLILIGTLPNVLKSESIWLTFRGAFTILGLVLLSSFGLYSCCKYANRALIGIIIFLYSLSSLHFFYHYFYQYPLTATRDTFFYERVLANYTKRLADQPVIIYTPNTTTFFHSLLVYTSALTKDSVHSISTAYVAKDYRFRNVEIRSGCFDPEVAREEDATIVVDYRIQLCESAQESDTAVPISPDITIASLIDSGGKFLIYNDTLCTEYPLKPYSYVQSSVFAVEKLSEETFCTAFFIN